MSVTRDVILDLLPLYLAGEASPATRELVEAHLQRDAELAELVRTQKTATPSLEVAPPTHDLELRALLRTRRLLGAQRWLFALAITFTAFSLAIRITLDGRRVTGLYPMIVDYPLVFGSFLVLAIGCWVAYHRLRRRLRHTSL